MKRFIYSVFVTSLLFFSTTAFMHGQEIHFESMMGTKYAWLETQNKDGISVGLGYFPSMIASQKLELPTLSIGIDDPNLQKFSNVVFSYVTIMGGKDDLSLTLDQSKKIPELRNLSNHYYYQWDGTQSLTITMPFVCTSVSVDGKRYWRPNNSTAVMNKKVKQFFSDNVFLRLEIHPENFGEPYVLNLDSDVCSQIKRLMKAFD